jgi:hypothetical protein
MSKHFHTTKEILDGAESPLDLGVIPNHMGINLCSVAGIGWTKGEDGQLVDLTIRFAPAPTPPA